MLNYHHLRYFKAVAQDGNLSRAAHRLNVSQSALSIQIRQLEDRLGHKLFDRIGRGLHLTEVGRIALDHAERIFGAGDDLLATLRQSGAGSTPLRVGALSTLSRNFQLGFLRPLMIRSDSAVVLKSGSMAHLMEDLSAMSLDVVLTTEIPARDGSPRFAARRIAEQSVEVHGTAHRLRHPSLAALLQNEPLIVPTQNDIRAGFEDLVAQLGITPRIAADVDDMAMIRLLAREDLGLAIAPPVVLADEIARGQLQTAPYSLGLRETFFAVTLPRKFPHPDLAMLLSLPGSEGEG